MMREGQLFKGQVLVISWFRVEPRSPAVPVRSLSAQDVQDVQDVDETDDATALEVGANDSVVSGHVVTWLVTWSSRQSTMRRVIIFSDF